MNTVSTPSTIRKIFLKVCFWSDCFQSPRSHVWQDDHHKTVVLVVELANENHAHSMAKFYKNLTIKEHGVTSPSRLGIALVPFIVTSKGKNKTVHKPFFSAIWVCDG
jgi:hypothetical protein